jgi:hypothetical protein
MHAAHASLGLAFLSDPYSHRPHVLHLIELLLPSLFLYLQLVGDCAYVRDQLTQYTTPSLPVFESWPADGGRRPDASAPGTRICQNANFSYTMTLPATNQGACSSGYLVSGLLSIHAGCVLCCHDVCKQPASVVESEFMALLPISSETCPADVLWCCCCCCCSFPHKRHSLRYRPTKHP